MKLSLESPPVSRVRYNTIDQRGRYLHKTVQTTCPRHAGFQQTQGGHSVSALKPLDDEECNGRYNPHDQGSNDRAVIPGFGLAAPLENQFEADD